MISAADFHFRNMVAEAFHFKATINRHFLFAMHIHIRFNAQSRDRGVKTLVEIVVFCIS